MANVAGNVNISGSTIEDLYPIRATLFQQLTAANTTTGIGNAGNVTLQLNLRCTVTCADAGAAPRPKAGGR